MKKEHEKQTFRRDLRQRADLYHDFHTEFGYLKSAVTTMVKTLSKVIITLKKGCNNSNSKTSIHQ